MKILLTAGTWNLIKNDDNTYGKKSGLIEKMYNELKKEKDFAISYFNGGNYNNLKELVLSAKDYDIVFWMANVPNELEKVRNVKTINPTALVIGSKKNHYILESDKMEYTFVEILNKSLIQRNNLTIEFMKLKNKDSFKMLLFDPLGTSWYEGFDIYKLVENIIKRIRFIITTKRERTYKVEGITNIIDNKEFFEYVKEVAQIFHNTIEHANGVTRFLGNASYRIPGNNHIFVTERDLDKTLINTSTIVESFLSNNKVYYYGDKKPSKDTVVQTRLYEILPNINYIVHSHCYANGGYFTNMPVPCGALDEIDEVLEVIKCNYNNDYKLKYYKINLKGHGCLIFGNSIDDLKKSKFITRHLPEYLGDTL